MNIFMSYEHEQKRSILRLFCIYLSCHMNRVVRVYKFLMKKTLISCRSQNNKRNIKKILFTKNWKFYTNMVRTFWFMFFNRWWWWIKMWNSKHLDQSAIHRVSYLIDFYIIIFNTHTHNGINYIHVFTMYTSNRNHTISVRQIISFIEW